MAFNAFMPGEDNWMQGKPMPGQAPQMGTPAAPAMTGQPQKPRPIMNAFSKIFEIGAPEAFEAGRQKKLTQNLGNALAGGDYSGAAEMALRGGQLDAGLKLRGIADERSQAQAAEQRKAQAQGTYQLFNSLQSAQINDYAMQDPAGFERMTGMTSEEYLSAAKQMQGVGMSPDQFRQFVIQKAQAELGITPEKHEYGFTNVEGVGLVRTDPRAGTADKVVGAPRKPIEINGVLVDPETYEPVADYRTPAQTGEMTDYQRAQLAAEAAQAANGPATPEFGDTWRMREAFEKRAQGFEEAQRQYFMMGDLAKDSTGASDIALGFAFFKTIDPTSTVREGEFAAAASAMGLNAALVQNFARLDKGEKFSPQLRQDLLQAAGHAYNQQAQDIQGLYEREAAFAGRMGVDPSLIVRNPVRPTQGEGTVFRGGRVEAIPPAAVDELLQDASPDAMREFDEVFGTGQAEQILRSQGRFPSRMTF